MAVTSGGTWCHVFAPVVAHNRSFLKGTVYSVQTEARFIRTHACKIHLEHGDVVFVLNPCVVAPSEGSVIAYYLSEFRVPVGQEAAVDKIMSSMETLVEKEKRAMKRPSNSLVLTDVVSSGRFHISHAVLLVAKSVTTLCVVVFLLLSSVCVLCFLSQRSIPE